MSRPFSRGFAPVSSGASTRLAFVGFCFTATAWLAGFGVILNIANLFFRFFPLPSALLWILNLVALCAWGGVNWWTSRQLLEGRRRALVGGVPVFAYGVFQEIANRPRDGLMMGIAVFSLLALLSVWNELDTW